MRHLIGLVVLGALVLAGGCGDDSDPMMGMDAGGTPTDSGPGGGDTGMGMDGMVGMDAGTMTSFGVVGDATMACPQPMADPMVFGMPVNTMGTARVVFTGEGGEVGEWSVGYAPGPLMADQGPVWFGCSMMGRDAMAAPITFDIRLDLRGATLPITAATMVPYIGDDPSITPNFTGSFRTFDDIGAPVTASFAIGNATQMSVTALDLTASSFAATVSGPGITGTGGMGDLTIELDLTW